MKNPNSNEYEFELDSNIFNSNPIPTKFQIQNKTIKKKQF